MIALLFPGQGSQFVGMGKELFEHFNVAKQTFQEVDEVLQQNLSRLIFCGDEAELKKTENAQPAIMVVSIAILNVLMELSGKKIQEIGSVCAGHSLGEYSALCAAGAITLSDAAKLLRKRGLAMNSAPAGAMIALVGANLEDASLLVNEASQYGVIEIGNDNGGGQVVLTGEETALQMAEKIASKFNIRRTVRLQVSGPFHSSLMKKAAVIMEEELRTIDIRPTVIPIIANATAEVMKNNTALVSQITNTVRWRETMISLKQDYKVSIAVEIGPGKVLSGLAKKSIEVSTHSLHYLDEIENFLSFLAKS